MKRYGLSAEERIKSKKDFEKIYLTGTTVFSADKKIKATYIIEKDVNKPVVKIAAAVHHKSGTAVWRNRVKRLIKEAYRLNKSLLCEMCFTKNVLLKIVFSPYFLNEKKNKKIMLDEVMPGILEIMLKLKSSL